MNVTFYTNVLRTLIILVCLVVPAFSLAAQDTAPTAIYLYHNEQVSLETLSSLTSQKYAISETYIDCVYVPSNQISTEESDHRFECFDTVQEAQHFMSGLRTSVPTSDNTNVEAENIPGRASCSYWGIYSQSLLAGSPAGQICVDQSIYLEGGIWSLLDAADNEVRLSDNPAYPGIRWTFGWTQYTLSSGPGGARQAYHCASTGC